MYQSKAELLLEYQSRIDQKARGNSSDLISNGTTEHAKILITTIFGKATRKIEIFTGFLNPEVYDDQRLIDSALRFLKKENTKMDVIVQEDDHTLISNALVNATKEKENFTIKEAGVKDKKEKCHFIVADGKSFRYEPDREKSTGIGCFYNTEVGNILTEYFSKLFKRAKELKV